jgi:ribosomal-protein-alanine N-acetyltransferase
MNLSNLPYMVMPMQLEDVPTISEIEQTVFTLPGSANTFMHEVRDNPSSEYLILRYKPVQQEPKERSILPRSVQRLFKAPPNEPSILGYGGFWMILEEAHICTLALRPEWRGRGLGELLLVFLIVRAQERGAEVITLEARVTNYRAQNLYRKYGFQVVGRRKGYYSDNNEDALIMTTDPIIAPEYQQRFRELMARLQERLDSQPNQPPTGQL